MVENQRGPGNWGYDPEDPKQIKIVREIYEIGRQLNREAALRARKQDQNWRYQPTTSQPEPEKRGCLAFLSALFFGRNQRQ